MQNAPILSIVIPCYNCASLVEDTLKSLEAQGFHNFEVICINDGSKDDTLAVLNSYSQNHSLNMKILDQENSGVSATRNRGIDVSEGKYILFLDADDMYHIDFVESLLRAVDDTNSDVAYCCLSRTYKDVFNKGHSEVQYVLQDQAQAMHQLLYKMGCFGFYCYIYRREILEKENIRFTTDSKFGEDREFIWKYMCHCKSIAFVDRVLYWYRPNISSATKGTASWRRTDSLSAVKRVEQYMTEKSIPFLDSYKDYMYARDMWAVAKAFAMSGDKQLFRRLTQNYNVKSCMKRTAKDRSKLVSLASWSYLIHPSLFYHIVRLKKLAEIGHIK